MGGGSYHEPWDGSLSHVNDVKFDYLDKVASTRFLLCKNSFSFEINHWGDALRLCASTTSHPCTSPNYGNCTIHNFGGYKIN